MNCLPGMIAVTSPRSFRQTLLRASLIVVVAWGCRPAALVAQQAPEELRYRVDYRVTLDPDALGARVEMRVRQPEHYLREVDMSTLGGRLTQFEGDGELSRDAAGRINWLPPAEGGTLRWFAELAHRRNGDGYDAYIEAEWALFRFEDIIPSADTRTLRGASSDTRVTVFRPEGWSVVTRYPEDGGTLRIVNPGRRFVTPTGWIVAGDLGVRIETIAGIRVVVAGPVGHDFRRMDILAMLHWTLPHIVRLMPRFPERLTIVGAGGPMWRGALSAPQSLYLHADRPLLSGNSTSTLLHELVHVGLRLAGEWGADWIVEGLAEYYSLEILRRSGTISEARYRDGHDKLASWAKRADTLCERRSSGSRTALAVTVMRAVDAEIRDKTNGRSSLDDVVHELSERDGKISVTDFRRLAGDVAGEALESLEYRELPGCDPGD